MSSSFCPCCGVDVVVRTLHENSKEVSVCSICSFKISEKDQIQFKTLKKVLCAEDNNFLRKSIEKIMIDKKLTQEFVGCPDGEAFLYSFFESHFKDDTISLIVLDVEMPKVTGINAAYALRAFERAAKRARPIPILFFTSSEFNQSLQDILNESKPSKYINKGVRSTPAQMAERLYAILYELVYRQSA